MRGIISNNTIKSTAILTLTAMIWGFAFVAQRSSMEHVGPFLFCSIRSILGGLTLVVFLLIRNRINNPGRLKNSTDQDLESKTSASLALNRKNLIIGGCACGFILFAGSNFQQVGLVFTTASKAGFITTLYIVLVPIFGLLLRYKTHWNSWTGVLLAAIGLYFLCISDTFDIQPGDLTVLCGAAFWAIHILVIAHFVKRVNAVHLSCLQFFVCGILSLTVMFFADHHFNAEVNLQSIISILPAILYTGILSSGVGFTLQAVGQKYANPTAASIIMSTEAVFSVVGGFLILGERFTPREFLGCVLMFIAVLLAQLPVKSKLDSAQNQTGSQE